MNVTARMLAALALIATAAGCGERRPAQDLIKEGDGFRLRGDGQKAIACYSRALKIDPKLEIAYQIRYGARKKKGDDAGAAADKWTIDEMELKGKP
jgi:tetratricopeptide (TPR) repeat protein